MVNATGTYYGDEVTFTTDTTSELYIGKLHAGGLIFYLDSTRQHGMVCAQMDQGRYIWGCNGSFIPTTSSNFGTGSMNTSLITMHCAQRPIAASVCADLALNGYTDWYLPSLGEVQLIFINLRLQNIGSFGLNHGYYWSSSLYSDGRVNVMNLLDGSIYYGGERDGWNIGGPCEIRAVRSF